MVVIAIIAILSMVGLSIFNGVQANARDSQRRSDIDAIAKALESAYTVSYPAPDPSMFAAGKIPQDPKNEDPYQYQYTFLLTFGSINPLISTTADISNFQYWKNSPSFIVCARLEKNNGNNAKYDGSAPDSGQAATYYCIKSRQ